MDLGQAFQRQALQGFAHRGAPEPHRIDDRLLGQHGPGTELQRDDFVFNCQISVMELGGLALGNWLGGHRDKPAEAERARLRTGPMPADADAVAGKRRDGTMLASMPVIGLIYGAGRQAPTRVGRRSGCYQEPLDISKMDY